MLHEAQRTSAPSAVTRPLIGGDVADAIARSLDGVNAGRGKLLDGVRHVRELDPVELEVLPRGEMAVAPVVDARHMGELAELVRRKRAVRDRDPQHIGVELQVHPVHQPQRLELVLGQLARKPARDLSAEFRRPLRDEGAVKLVVDVHLAPVPPGAKDPLTLSLSPRGERTLKGRSPQWESSQPSSPSPPGERAGVRGSYSYLSL